MSTSKTTAGSAGGIAVERDGSLGAAEFLVSFINTRTDGAGNVERFGNAADFTAWGAEMGLLEAGETATESDAVAARELREALRVVLRIHSNDDELQAGQIDAAERFLREAGARYSLVAVVTSDGADLVAEANGVPGILGTVFAAATIAAQRGEWNLVKACRSPVCHRAFFDRTRNHGGHFCSAGCGSRVSMRAHRERQRQSAK